MVSRTIVLPDSVKFGEDFELDVRAFELRSAGIPLKLKPIPMELLILLIERRGELVTREQIVERIWGKGVFLDTDNSINGAISKIRQLLRDDPERPKFVQTVTGKGYRFLAPVEISSTPTVETAPDVSMPPAAAAPVFAEPGPVTEKSDSRLLTIILSAAIALTAVAVAYFQWIEPRIHSHPVPARAMIAVLPFENLTGDAGQDYFSDGMTEEMITQLGRLDPGHLGVIARTSVMHYKHSQDSLDEISRSLGVQYVLEGSLRRDGERVRITAQLVQVKDQTRLWSQQYDRKVNDLLAVQSEIAREISHEIQIALGNHKPIAPAPKQIAPPESEAYDLYLKGLYFWNKRNIDGLRQAINYFQQATVKDPNDARAYAGLADSYALMGGYSGAPSGEFMSQARTAAQRAVELDDSLPEAHTALALIVQNYDFDWQTSEKEFKRAIEINENYSTAHQWYAEHLMWQGRFEEALRESERARQLDPLSLIIASDNAVILLNSRQYDRAIAQFRAVLDLDPGFPRAHMIRHAYIEKGMFNEAAADVEALIPANTPWYWTELATVRGRAGRNHEAQHALEKLLELRRDQPVDRCAMTHDFRTCSTVSGCLSEPPCRLSPHPCSIETS